MWKMNKTISLLLIVVTMYGCAEITPQPLEPSTGHIPATPVIPQSNIPDIIQQTSILPEPEQLTEEAKYTVVVNEVPVKELLFALARDAEINIDIHPEIVGVVTINAVDQTLPQILNRVARQVSLRYEFIDNNLIISPDTDFVRTYNIGYLNLSRDTTGTVTVSTAIASGSSGGDGGGGGSNTSTTSISSESSHQFWENLRLSIIAVITDPESDTSAEDAVTSNPESGIISVRTTAFKHQQVQRLIDQILERVQRQVLVQATIVEVDLSDQFQAGIDWSVLDLNSRGFSIASNLLGGAPGALAGPPITSSSMVLNYNAPSGSGEQISAAISLLSEFGDTRVLSSPQIMVLNNHTAVLKVVENFVYFEVTQEIEPSTAIGGSATVATTTTAQTVPVGLVLTVTPQISDDDSVTFNVRPTISSVVRTELDPNPTLTIANRIPVIRVREMESILKINTNQVAVLGGLMQDTLRTQDKKTPFAADLPIIGNLFKSQNQESLKTELVIFLRPVVIKNASIDGDLKDFRKYLESSAYSPGNTGSQEQ
ncbi:MAG: MSHA biogenesis protein MshL [Gammaproteobacteria bacterium]|jgi:MSHA biogenesis protein MshL